MSALGLKVMDETVQTTNIWLKDLMVLTGWGERQRAYRLLRATLHVLRDRLPVNEAVHLGSELPMLLRGLYYEGWRPAGKPLKLRSRAEFIAHIEATMKPDQLADPEAAVGAVLALLLARISSGEMADVRHAMPSEIRELFAA
jgi:uncharacterized protein (DUF2267 family)